MTESLTSLQLLLHITNELPPAERNSFEHLLISDEGLQHEYQQTEQLIGLLQNDEQLEPTDSTMRLLLDYASH